jgi:hypothetical protein
MSPAPADVPEWAKLLVGAAMVFGAFVGTILQYIKTGKQSTPTNDVAVVSATFADRKTIEHLAEKIEHLTTALEREERTLHDFAEESRRTRQSIDANTDAQINLLRFMNRNAQ